MLVTLDGMVIEVRPRQSWNASFSMLVTLEGILIEVRAEQLSNAYCPMVITVFGMIVLLKPWVSVFEAVWIMALQLFLESYTVLSASTLIEDKLEQYRNA